MDDDDDNDGSMESLVQEMGTDEQIGFIIDHLGPFKAKSVLSKCRSMDEGMEEESEDDDDLRTLSFLTVKIGRVTCTGARLSDGSRYPKRRQGNILNHLYQRSVYGHNQRQHRSRRQKNRTASKFQSLPSP